MLTERLQILVSPEQRRRLEAEAQRRELSVGAVVREAVDAQLGLPTREERMQAIEEVAAMRAEYVPPDELEAILDAQHDDVLPRWPSS